MKRIFVVFMAVFMFILGGCNAKKDNNLDLSNVTKMMDKLDSYQLVADMTIYKDTKEIKANVAVDYLKPSYYKVSLKTLNGHEQIILKNNDGVYVLTPSIGKQFKFESEWPKASAHAYLVDQLWKDIKLDTNMNYQIGNEEIIINSSFKEAINDIKNIKMYYSKTKNYPTKIELLSEDNNIKVLVNITSFTANPKLGIEIFNHSAIMSEGNLGDGNDTQTSLTLEVGYIIADTTLQSSRITEDCSIMCYGGAKNYTIVAKRIEISDMEVLLPINDYDILECGIMAYSNNSSRYFVGDLEITVFSSTLSMEEAYSIISEITFS